MPASTPRSPSRAPGAPGPRRALAGDSQAVSEVVGYLLVFGILSIVLVLAMSAFAVGQESAKERAVALHAESAAARVAGVVVQSAVLWERQHTTGGDVAVAYLVDLPEQFEGADYVVRLEPRDPPTCTITCTTPDLVRVLVPSLDVDVTAPIFSASAPADLAICDQGLGYTEAPGGPLNIRINAPISGSDPVPAGCSSNELFLEEA